MKIKCLNGFFIFEESRVGECADFMGLFKVDLVPFENNFTFKELENPPEYSIKGGKYLGADCIKTYSGRPWEIFKENNFVFNFGDGLIVQKSTITLPIDIQTVGNYYSSGGLIIPGSIYAEKQVSSYTAYYSFDKARFRYSEVTLD